MNASLTLEYYLVAYHQELISLVYRKRSTPLAVHEEALKKAEALSMYN